MQVTKKLKLTLATALAACCFGTAVAGIATVSNTALAADKATWSTGFFGAKSDPVMVDTVATNDGGAVQATSLVNILDMPNSTIAFNMYFSDSNPWSGMFFTNGVQSIPGTPWTQGGKDETAFPWYSIGFWDGGAGSMILHDDRYGGTFSGIHNGGEAKGWKTQMLPIEIHIGQGNDKEDPSYIKVNGKMLMHEDHNDRNLCLPETRAAFNGGNPTKELTASLFPKGCYLALGYNPATAGKVYLSEGSQFYVSDPSIKMTSQIQAGAFTKDASVKLVALNDQVFAEGYKLTVKFNGHALTADQYEVSLNDKTATVTVKADTMNKLDLNWYLPASFLTYTITNAAGDKSFGSTATSFNIKVEDPPVFTTGTDLVLTEKKPFSLKFTYSGAHDILGQGIELRSALNNKLVDYEVAEPTTDYTITKGENDEYTITFTQAYVDEIFANHHSRAFRIVFGIHMMDDVHVYYDVDTAEKGVRLNEGSDYVAGSLVQDDFYTSANIMKFAEASLSSRIFYEKPVPADQPITVEYGYIDPTVEWAMIAFMSTNKISEYFSNETTTAQGNKLSQIFFGGDRKDFQKLDGWANDGSSTNVTYDYATKMKNNFVTVVLGVEAEDSYMEINGERLSNKLSVKQSDFPDGVYVGFFYNNQKGSHYETVNTHLNPVTITAPQADNAYAMDLGAATDFEVTLATASTSGKLTITDDRGTTLPASDYSYDSASGKLTIKANYFTNRLFVKQGEIRIWDTEKKTGTAFKMAFSNVNLQPSKVAFTTPGSGDVTFDLGISGSVTGITTSDEPIADSAYTVNGGSVTIKAAAITVSSGIQEFIVQSAGKLYPCYVDVQNWADGIYKTGNGTVAKAGDGYKVTGAATYELEKIIDFTAGYSIGISFDKIGAYYENGLVVSKGGKYTGVQLKFYDPYTAYTLLVGLYANYSDDNISTANGALYIDYRISNAQGGVVATGRQASLQASKDHPSATGLQALQLKENNGGLQITAAGRDFNLTKDNLKGFNLAACILTVSAANATDDSVVTVTIFDGTVDVYDKLSGGETPGENPGENPGGNTPGENPGGDEPTEEKKGCGSVIGSGIGVALAVLTAAAALVVVLRKKSTK